MKRQLYEVTTHYRRLVNRRDEQNVRAESAFEAMAPFKNDPAVYQIDVWDGQEQTTWLRADNPQPTEPIKEPLRTEAQRAPYMLDEHTIECIVAVPLSDITLLIPGEAEPGGMYDDLFDLLSKAVTGSPGVLSNIRYTAVGGKQNDGTGTVHLLVTGEIEDVAVVVDDWITMPGSAERCEGCALQFRLTNGTGPSEVRVVKDGKVLAFGYAVDAVHTWRIDETDETPGVDCELDEEDVAWIEEQLKLKGDA